MEAIPLAISSAMRPKDAYAAAIRGLDAAATMALLMAAATVSVVEAGVACNVIILLILLMARPRPSQIASLAAVVGASRRSGTLRMKSSEPLFLCSGSDAFNPDVDCRTAKACVMLLMAVANFVAVASASAAGTVVTVSATTAIAAATMAVTVKTFAMNAATAAVQMAAVMAVMFAAASGLICNLGCNTLVALTSSLD